MEALAAGLVFYLAGLALVIIVLLFIPQKKVMLRHEQSGLIKTGYYGFSRTYFLFGWFVPLFRGEIGIAALHLLFSALTFGLWQLIASFIYNRQYTTRLLTSGWVVADTPDRVARASMALGIAVPA